MGIDDLADVWNIFSRVGPSWSGFSAFIMSKVMDTHAACTWKYVQRKRGKEKHTHPAILFFTPVCVVVSSTPFSIAQFSVHFYLLLRQTFSSYFHSEYFSPETQARFCRRVRHRFRVPIPLLGSRGMSKIHKLLHSRRMHRGGPYHFLAAPFPT